MHRRSSSSNFSFLFDESKGCGKLAARWPGAAEANGVPFGYAGGLGPSNIAAQLVRIAHAAEGAPVWVDMESSLRTVRQWHRADGTAVTEDIFDVSKAVCCLEAAADLGVRGMRGGR